MHARLSSSSSTLSKNLTTRDETQDFAIAFLDSTAVVLDVLTFYQERIANEAFLSTALERRSILELAREIGYELRPGAAASTFLAFNLDDFTSPSSTGISTVSLSTSSGVPIGNISSATSSAKTIIDIGVKAQSLPLSGSDMPQIFETTTKIEARTAWNNLKPQLMERQDVDEYSQVVLLKGISTQLNAGDGLLIVKRKITTSDNGTTKTERTFFRTVSKVEPIVERQITKVTLLGAEVINTAVAGINVLSGSGILGSSPSITKMQSDSLKFVAGGLSKLNPDEKNALASSKLSMPQVALSAAKNKLDAGEFLQILKKWSSKIIANNERIIDSTQVFAFRVKAGAFGCNAPDYKTLPSSMVGSIPDWDSHSPRPLAINKKRIFTLSDGSLEIRDINYDIYSGDKGKLIYLDNVYQSIVPTSESDDSWAVVKSAKPSAGTIICRISQVSQENVVGFLLNTRVTGLHLDIEDGSKVSHFSFRNTTVYAKSEELELASISIEEPVGGSDTITLDAPEAYLKQGQIVSITGEVVDNTNDSLEIIRSEIAIISEIMLDQYAHTVIKFKDSLQNKYRRDTVNINANVARATHGQTKTAILGGGDPAQSLLSFVLKEKPLTYVSAPTESGVQSTLELYVDNVKWHEVSSLYFLESEERGYVIRQDNDSQTSITFGDGAPNGRSPNAGLDNIRARYRVGIGIDGMVAAGQISLLMDRPAGVRGVTNPLAPTGAADPERLEQAKLNAPLSVLTLGRVVSILDYENYARAFAGIGKAHATWVWEGDEKIVFLTIASEVGTEVDTNSDLYRNLFRSITRFKDPVSKFRIGSFLLKLFNIKGRILVENGYQFENVKEAVEDILNEKFSFRERQFGQPVTISEIISLVQHVEGVGAVSIDALYLSQESPVNGNDAISSNIAHWDDNEKRVVLAELVIINTIPGSGGTGIDIKQIKAESSESGSSGVSAVQ